MKWLGDTGDTLADNNEIDCMTWVCIGNVIQVLLCMSERWQSICIH